MLSIIFSWDAATFDIQCRVRVSSMCKEKKYIYFIYMCIYYYILTLCGFESLNILNSLPGPSPAGLEHEAFSSSDEDEQGNGHKIAKRKDPAGTAFQESNL